MEKQKYGRHPANKVWGVIDNASQSGNMATAKVLAFLLDHIVDKRCHSGVVADLR